MSVRGTGWPRWIAVVGLATVVVLGFCVFRAVSAGKPEVTTDPVESGALHVHDVRAPRSAAQGQAFIDHASSDPAAALAVCTASRAAELAITTSFVDPSLTVDTVYATEFGGLTYYGTNVFRADGVRESSADVWVTDGSDEGLAAVSASARVLSDLPDARNKYGVSAGGGPVLRVQGCSIAHLLSG